MTLPDGIVTFLFTDIEGSTALLRALGRRFDATLDRHHAIVRAAIRAHHGHEVRVAGDGFFVAFERPADALAAAIDAQKEIGLEPWPEGARVRVRMGIHTGEARASGPDYVGLAVHHAARIGGIGHGGQVLVSHATVELVNEAAPSELSFTSLGEYTLKDFGRPETIYQLVHADLEQTFPAIRTERIRSHNLPTIGTTYVEHAGELDRLIAALEKPSLITLTGPGGCGKSRAAVELGLRMLDSFPGGTWFVELADLVDPAQIPDAVVSALDLRDAGGGSEHDRIATFIGTRATLLLLDNCEHLVQACGELIVRLMARCPQLRVVATSRDLLGLEAEIAWRMPSLSVADPDSGVATIAESEAVRLFVERAGRASPGFRIDPGNAATVARICRRLDGIPFAIELAAARLRHFEVDEIEKRLDDAFSLLTGGARRALQRHQTLSGAIDWSYNLLDDAERGLLVRLGVFAGGFTLASAEAVCVDDQPIADTLFRLVDRSLVEREASGGRFRLLQVVQQYALDKLNAGGEAEATRNRHAEHFAALASDLGSQVFAPSFYEALEAFDREFENLRAARDWRATAPDIRGMVQIVTPLAIYMVAAGHHEEWIRWTTEVEQRLSTSDLDPVERGSVLAALCLGTGYNDMEEGVRLSSQALTSFEAAGDSAHLGYTQALLVQGWARTFTDDWNEAQALLMEGIRLARAAGQEPWVAQGTAWFAWAIRMHGELDRARELMGESLAKARALDSPFLLSWILFWSAMMAVHARDFQAARRYYEEVIPHFRRVSYRLWLQWALDHVAIASASTNDIAAALSYAEEGLEVSKRAGLVGRGNYPSLVATMTVLCRMAGDDRARSFAEEACALAKPGTITGVIASIELAGVLHQTDDRVAAARTLREAVDVLRGLEPERLITGAMNFPPVARALTEAAWMLEDTQPASAVELLAAAAAWRDANDQPLRIGLDQHQRRVEVVCARAGDAAAAAWEQGERLGADEALARALKLIDQLLP